ncbi:hypothetical protein [Nonomuraea sp. NPDC002799]
MERALDLLAQCAYRFWDDHGTDEIGALLAEARACYNAAEHADPAAVAMGRSLIASFELRLCTDVENQLSSGWDYDLEGPPLNGVEEDDGDDVSRPAAEAARAALNADPEDPLVPIHLGHALAWLGDRDGAVAAYREALRHERSGTTKSRPTKMISLFGFLVGEANPLTTSVPHIRVPAFPPATRTWRSSWS